MTDREQQLLDLFEKYKEDLDGGKFEALCEFAEECNKDDVLLSENLYITSIHIYDLNHKVIR